MQNEIIVRKHTLAKNARVVITPAVISSLFNLQQKHDALKCPTFSTFRYFPFGIVFLVAGKILEMDDPSAMGKKLGFYAITVVMGLVLHGLFILPAMYFFITKKSPIVYIRGILQALLISLATSSR